MVGVEAGEAVKRGPVLQIPVYQEKEWENHDNSHWEPSSVFPSGCREEGGCGNKYREARAQGVLEIPGACLHARVPSLQKEDSLALDATEHT